MYFIETLVPIIFPETTEYKNIYLQGVNENFKNVFWSNRIKENKKG